MRIMGVDYGDVRTGIALSDENAFLASGICTLKIDYNVKLAAEIVRFAEEKGVAKIVIGNPINMNGTCGPRSEKAEELKRLIREKTDIEVILFDERCTTKVAHSIMNFTDTRGKKRKSNIDTLSAEIILQNYLDSISNKIEKGL